MLKNFARNPLRKPRALRAELEKSIQWWPILIRPPCQLLTHQSLTALGAWERSWRLPGLPVHPWSRTGVRILPDFQLFHFGPRFKGLQMLLAGYSCFRPLTTLMVRADFDLTFCKSDWFLLKSMWKEQREDQGPGWWPWRGAWSSTRCQRWWEWFTKSVNFCEDYHYGN